MSKIHSAFSTIMDTLLAFSPSGQALEQRQTDLLTRAQTAVTRLQEELNQRSQESQATIAKARVDYEKEVSKLNQQLIDQALLSLSSTPLDPEHIERISSVQKFYFEQLQNRIEEEECEQQLLLAETEQNMLLIFDNLDKEWGLIEKKVEALHESDKANAAKKVKDHAAFLKAFKTQSISDEKQFKLDLEEEKNKMEAGRILQAQIFEQNRIKKEQRIREKEVDTKRSNQKKKIENLKRKHQNELSQMESTHDQEKRKEVARVSKKFRNKISDLETETETLKTDQDRLKGRIEKLKESKKRIIARRDELKAVAVAALLINKKK